MLKPIVSMNQMAMNESIATTCCYVWNGTSLLGSASLPHGGQLVAGSTTTYYTWNEGRTSAAAINGSWLNWKGGHVNTKYAGYRYNAVDSQGNNIAFISDKNGVKIADLYNADGTVNTAVATAGYCDHKGADCWYTKETSFDKTFTHVGATSAHYTWTSGHEWLKDHTAVQFSS